MEYFQRNQIIFKLIKEGRKPDARIKKVKNFIDHHPFTSGSNANFGLHKN
ncbi:hypothetical protein BN1423_320009 [Carnobacterium maltaromaticum]|nr:conserved hypothetical protein [Carnobacterium maltaromaticum]CAD5900861.1 conserved hypothetical protein [Carnobacterium maltaromaticum]CRH19982.1 hypothetical protein CM318V1_580054 [Carnobacterium maltaromaticum]CRH22374.1 hypothetical protein BN1423_320009 [Carnobacterium maltaromaticum]